jgi:predicted transcriptional regulator of viral defense system
MKIEKNRLKTLSAKEIELLTRLEFEGRDIYTRENITSYCANRQKAAYLIRKLLEKKRLRKIVKNIYFFVPMKAPGGQWAANEYLIAKALARGARYYIGYSPVFYSYGFTEQVAQLIYIVNDRYSMLKTIFGVRYKLIKVLPNRLYGLETRKIQNEDVVFPKKERAMIDVFEFYNVKKASSILSSQIGKLDIPLFIDYLTRYPVQKIRRRIGYFMDGLGVSKKLLEKIDIGQKGYPCLYDTGPGKGKIDKTWRLIING